MVHTHPQTDTSKKVVSFYGKKLLFRDISTDFLGGRKQEGEA